MDAYRIRDSISLDVAASPERLFAFLDDPVHLGAHMQRRNWQTAGMRMTYELDERRAQAIGSRIVLQGRAFGLALRVEQVVIERDPPHHKAWETVGPVKLVVVGAYRMEVHIEPARGEVSRLSVGIACEPAPPCPRWLTRLYARWCVRRMASDAADHFRRVRR